MLSATASLTDRFAWLFDGLCKAIGAEAHKHRMEAALAWAVWNRVRVLGERFIALAARARAGTLTARRTPYPNLPPQGGTEREAQAGAASGPAAGSRDARCGPTARLPREFGWVTTVLPRTGQFAGVLSWLLRDPEVAALVETAPEAGRILRPLCHLLGVQAPEFLRRGYGAAEGPPPHPTPGSILGSSPGTGASLPPPGAERNEAPVAAEVLPAEQVSVTAEVAAEAQAPPQPSPAPRPYHLRPGGLIWDGTRLNWT